MAAYKICTRVSRWRSRGDARKRRAEPTSRGNFHLVILRERGYEKRRREKLLLAEMYNKVPFWNENALKGLEVLERT